MKVINIEIYYNWEDIDIENGNIDAYITADDGYEYVLNFATPKHLQVSMDYEKWEYYQGGYPLIIVNKLTREIVEQAVKSFAEKAGGYWLKFYHFGALQTGEIDESIFDQLKAKPAKRREKLDEFNE